MRVYSPYQTEKALQCEARYDFEKRWEVEEEKWTPYMLVGRAVAKGLEKLKKGDPKGFETAAEVLAQGYVPNHEWSLKSLVAKTHTAIKLGLGANLGLEVITGIEQAFTHTRPDIVGRDEQGRLGVRDWKVKFQIDDRYFEKELDSYITRPQLITYAHIVGQYYGESVATIGAIVLVLSPIESVFPHIVEVTPEYIAYMAEGLSNTWARMAAIDSGQERPVPNGTSCNDYGGCPFRPGCVAYAGDESKFEALYKRRSEWR